MRPRGRNQKELDEGRLKGQLQDNRDTCGCIDPESARCPAHRPPMCATLRRCRKGRMTSGDWRKPVRVHVSLGVSMPKITGILKIYPPSVAPVKCGKPAAKRRGFHAERFKARSCRPPHGAVGDGSEPPGVSMAASQPLASVPDMPVRKVSIRR